jgi:3-phosphoshikimate 1-carboxyvinyltransferase
MPVRSAATVAVVTPARRLRGRLRAPGDKSISHRYAMLAALAEGRSTLANYAPGADCQSTLLCLRALGVDIEEGSAGAVTLMGRGLGRLRSPSGPLDAGNSGTTMRLMAGILAGHPFSVTLGGDASLSARPMGRVIAPLERMGARLDATDGHAPLVVHGARLRAIAHQSLVPSAQVKSAVLLAGLHAEGTTSVTEPAATRDHTERALTAFGGRVIVDGLTVSVLPGQRLQGRALTVPGDLSSAAFWFIAAAALPGSRVEVEDVGLNPTRTALLGVLRRFGAHVEVTPAAPDGPGDEPRGLVAVEHDRVGRLTIRPDEVPGLIDELPALAALAAHGGEVSVSGAGELRVKETDRIAALVAGFRALGVEADERADGFVVSGSSARPSGGTADARGDHRMAMAFAIAALGADRPSLIAGADAVGISYPGFFETLERLVAPSDRLGAP